MYIWVITNLLALDSLFNLKPSITMNIEFSEPNFPIVYLDIMRLQNIRDSN